MSSEMVPYIVRQGDYLVKLGWIHGFDPEEVWNDPKNEELKKLRGDHNVLAPGDVIHIPVKQQEGLPIEKGSVNRYVVTVPKITVSVIFMNSDDCPLADEPCEILGAAALGIATDTRTDEDGKLTLRVPVHVREFEVNFPARSARYTIRVGDLDPHDERTGALQRLQNLGYCPPLGEMGPESEAILAAAVADFQSAENLPVTGVLDAETVKALAGKHQS